MKPTTRSLLSKSAAIAAAALALQATVAVPSAYAWWDIISWKPFERVWVPEGMVKINDSTSGGGSWGDDIGCTSQSCITMVFSSPEARNCLLGGAALVHAGPKFYCTKKTTRTPTSATGKSALPGVFSGALTAQDVSVAGACFSSMVTGLALRDARLSCIATPGFYTSSTPGPTPAELRSQPSS